MKKAEYKPLTPVRFLVHEFGQAYLHKANRHKRGIVLSPEPTVQLHGGGGKKRTGVARAKFYDYSNGSITEVNLAHIQKETKLISREDLVRENFGYCFCGCVDIRLLYLLDGELIENLEESLELYKTDKSRFTPRVFESEDEAEAAVKDLGLEFC